MQRVLCFIGFSLLGFMLFSCGEPVVMSDLSLSIDQHPQGGTYVSSLSCTFTGNLIDKAPAQPPIDEVHVTVQWMTEQGSHKKETFIFESEESATYTTTFSAPPGLYLDKTFWVLFTWMDFDGDQTRESDRAVCICP